MIGRTGLAALAAALVACAPGARAETTRDIPYYMRSPQLRAATLSLCRSDHRYDRNVDCRNATSAEEILWRMRLQAQLAMPAGVTRGGSFADFQTPSYYAANRLARRGVLASCRNHPGMTFSSTVCASAAQGEAMDAGHN